MAFVEWHSSAKLGNLPLGASVMVFEFVLQFQTVLETFAKLSELSSVLKQTRAFDSRRKMKNFVFRQVNFLSLEGCFSDEIS